MKPVALITGGTRGIGLAISTILAKNGYDLAINGVRDEMSVKGVIKTLEATGARVVYCQGDIGEDESRKSIIRETRDAFNRLNVLVNNAGVAPEKRQSPLDATEESFERVMKINLQGPYFLTRLAARWMIEQKKNDGGFNAAVINIGSVSAEVVSDFRGEYCMSKAGFSMHSKIWAVHLAAHGIPVYEVRPGIIDTDMTAAVKDKYDKLIAGGLTVQPRWGSPEDVAKAVLALVKGYFPYSTGEVFMVDGGLQTPRL